MFRASSLHESGRLSPPKRRSQAEHGNEDNENTYALNALHDCRNPITIGRNACQILTVR